MEQKLERQLADFLHARRGDQTLTQFAWLLRLSTSTVYRMEMCDQSVTLRCLQQILRRLLPDIFPAEYSQTQKQPKGCDP